MNICHTYHPPILHRDLKNANIFVTHDWVCKVGDFGLSRNVKAVGVGVSLSKIGAAGTSQYYPPEILKSEFFLKSPLEKVSTESDVWSFGLMLWEIFTQKVAWKEFLDSISWNADQFSDALCNKGQLPDMDDKIPSQIRDIITSCLKTNRQERPSFAVLVDQLIEAQINYFLNTSIDERTNLFWKRHWIKDKWEAFNKVSWEKFYPAFKNLTHVEGNMPSDDAPIMKFIKGKLTTPDNHVTLVTLEKVILWFGPLVSENGGNNIYSQIKKFEDTEGFRIDDTSSDLAKQLLEKEPEGTFLIRLNLGTSEPVKDAPWTISVKKKEGVSHFRITLNPITKEVSSPSFEKVNNKRINSIFEFFEELKKEYNTIFKIPLQRSAQIKSEYETKG